MNKTEYYRQLGLCVPAIVGHETLLRQLVIPYTYTCTNMYIHVHTVYIHVYTMYMSTNNFLHVPLGYFPLQTRLYRLKGATYNAIVQESAILCVRGS